MNFIFCLDRAQCVQAQFSWACLEWISLIHVFNYILIVIYFYLLKILLDRKAKNLSNLDLYFDFFMRKNMITCWEKKKSKVKLGQVGLKAAYHM